MKNLLRIAAFRALAPDDGAGAAAASNEGSPAPGVGEFDLDASADAAYEAAMRASDDTETEKTEGEGTDADAETKTEGDADEDADDDKTEGEDDRGDGDDGDDGDVASELPAEVVAQYPMAKFYSDLNAGLTDPATAPQTLRWLAEETAKAHGTTIESLLGLQAAPEKKAEGDADADKPDWKAAGFDSLAEYEAAPDWERLGYDSAGEYKLAKELAELKATVAPILQEREETTKATAESKAKAEWEGAIQKIAPTAIAAVKTEIGWEATPAQALDAARKFPQLASQPGGLKEAILAAFVRDIAKAAQAKGRGARPAPPELPSGERRGGVKELSYDDRTDVQKLADRAYEVAAS